MKTSLKKLTSVFLAVLMLISVFSVVGVSAADTNTTVTGYSGSFTFHPGEAAENNPTWYVWTWNQAEGGGEFVKGTGEGDSIHFDGVGDTVVFLRMENGAEPDWNACWNRTGDVKVQGSDAYFSKWSGQVEGKDAFEVTWDGSSGGGGGGGGTTGDYYLVGYINAVDVEGNDYHFENGQLTLSVTGETYVAVKNGAGEWYMTHGFPGMDATSTTLYKTYYGEEGTDKFFVPTGEITLTLTENGDGTLTISYSNGGGGGGDDPQPQPQPTGDYYLVGYINAVDVEGNDYHFENGQLTLSVTGETYVAVKNGAGEWYMTHGFPGMDATSTTLYKTYYGEEGTDKFFLPTGEITLTLTENGDGTLTISYSNGGGGGGDDPQPQPQPTGDYYLVGYINAVDVEGNDYPFVNGQLSLSVTGETYVAVKNSAGEWYMTHGFPGMDATSTTLYKTYYGEEGTDKFFLPTGELTLTLSENGDGTLTISYSNGGGDITDPVVTDPVVTDPVVTDPVVTDPPTDPPTSAPTQAPTTSTSATSSETKATDPETTIPGQTGLNIITALNGTTVSTPTNVTGKTVSVSYSLTAPLLLEDAQGTLNYDSSKLKLAKFEVPNVSSQLTTNLELPNAAKFNFTGVNGVTSSGIYDFKNGAVLVKATFSVVDGVTGSTTIDLVIEELDGLEGGNQVSYFTNSMPSADANTVIQSLSNPKVESSDDTIPTSSPTDSSNTTPTGGETSSTGGEVTTPTDDSSGSTTPNTSESVTSPTANTTAKPAPKPTQPTTSVKPSKNVGKGTSVASADKFVKGLKNDKDPKGSVFNGLKAKSSKVKKTSIKVTWSKVKKAKGYIVYGNKCGKSYKKIKTVKGTSYTQKKLKKGTYYKYLIMAYDKNNKILSTSKTLHVATTGGKYGNYKSVKLNKTKISLKKGKTYKLKATCKKQSKKLKVKNHRKVKYESTNTKIATVSSSGKIKAKKKGTCYIYAYAQNGVYKKAKVTVKK